MSCENCGRSLTGERQKGHVYYRCHKRGCKGASVREEQVESAIQEKLVGLHVAPEEIECIEGILAEERAKASTFADAQGNAAKLTLGSLTVRQNRLTDAYVDGALDKADFEQRKAALMMERCEAEQKLARAEIGQSDEMLSVERRFELIKHASLLYETGLSTESRDLLEDVVSNLTASGKTITITVKEPLSQVAMRPRIPSGGSLRGEFRTFWQCLLQEVSI